MVFRSLFDIQNEERISMLKTSCNSIEQILNSSIAIKEEYTNDLHSLRVRYKIFLDMENEENYDILVNYNEEKTDGMILYQKNGTFLNSNIYKNKPGNLNTVDLLIHIVSSNKGNTNNKAKDK